VKRLVGFLFLTLMTALVSAQSVDSSQIKLGVNKGLGGDAVNGLSVKIYRSTTAPASPQAGNLWLDTNTSPASCKEYDGAAWQVCSTYTVLTTQADLTSFPASPSDGQFFYDKSHFTIWVYDGTAGAWYAANGTGAHTGSAIVDNFTGTKITDPSVGTFSSADNATAGNVTAGAHSFKMTCANSTGGETLPTAKTASVTYTASHSINLSNIPTCSGGPTTTARRVYMSKAAQDLSGPWYWVLTIADNTTTTLTAQAGLSDANLVLLVTKTNFSAALDARWTVTNTTASTTSGGCGATGSSMVCKSSNSAPPNSFGSSTTDPTVRAAVDISPYKTGDYTIQYRITNLTLSGDSADGTMNNPVLGILRVNSADNERGYWIGLGNDNGCNGGGATAFTWTSPLGADNTGYVHMTTRTAAAANWGTTGTCAQNAVKISPHIGTSIWVKFVKRGTFLNGFVGKDGVNWVALPSCMETQLNANNCSAGERFDITTPNPTQFEIDVMNSNANSSTRHYIEIDQFTLTVN